MKNKIYVLGIDIQNDFLDLPNNEIEKLNGHKPTMSVKGSWNDTQNLVKFIKEQSNSIEKIVLTFDTHNRYHVAHPMFWINSDNENPEPFTLITNEDVANKKWIPTDQSLHQKMLDYTKELENSGNLTLCIWPEHCILGNQGHNLPFILQDQIKEWENIKGLSPKKYLKGLYPFSESYGAVHAEVVEDDVEETQANINLINEFKNLNDYDYVVVAGQALSHCVSATIDQLSRYQDYINKSGDFIKKVILMSDGTSPVSGFEENSNKFLEKFKNKGMQVMTSDEIKELLND